MKLLTGPPFVTVIQELRQKPRHIKKQEGKRGGKLPVPLVFPDGFQHTERPGKLFLNPT
jgi:hypothetical protein